MNKAALALVAILSLAGSSAPVNHTSLKTRIEAPKPGPSSLPIPMCPPDDPNACGIVH